MGSVTYAAKERNDKNEGDETAKAVRTDGPLGYIGCDIGVQIVRRVSVLSRCDRTRKRGERGGDGRDDREYIRLPPAID